LGFFAFLFILKKPEFELAGNIFAPDDVLSMVILDGGHIDFRREGLINLKPPLRALFKSRPK
jgi:hypothetical protein